MRTVNRADGGDISIAGGRTRSAAVYVDGVINSRTGIGATISEFSPPVDSIQEFRVEANAPGADYGRSAAGFINAVTKSGSNTFHGAAYEFLRNDKLDARGWAADSKTKLRRNTFGGNLGGPIVRNRAFFFYNVEQLIENRAALRTRDVPLDNWRSGDFSGLQRSQATSAGLVAVPQVLYDPGAGTGQQGGLSPFPNNVIPQNRLDPVALKVMSFYPKANRRPDDPITQRGNWQANIPVEVRRTTHTTRMDYDFGAKDKLYGRYTIFSPADDRQTASPEWGYADPNAVNSPIRQQNLALNYTHLFSPTLLLNANAGFFRFFNFAQGNGFGQNIPAQLGLSGVGPDVFPTFNIGGDPGIGSIGSSGTHNRRFAFTNFEYTASLTLIRGNHTLKIGGDYRRYRGDEEGRQQASGVFGFSGISTRGLNPNGSVIANTGASMADFLLGRIDSLSLRAAGGLGRRSYYSAGYIQNEWRATRRLTLNLGVRYSYESPFWEVAGRMANFDPTVTNPIAGALGVPAGQRGVITFANRNGYGRTLIEPDKNNLEPRFGFAWRPTGSESTVIRGGFGVFFGNPYDGNVLQSGSDGFIAKGAVSGGAPFTLAQGVPAGTLTIPAEQDLSPSFGTVASRFPLSTVEVVDPFRRTPYALDYNVTVQRQIGGYLLDGRYFAKLGRKIAFRSMNLNQIPRELLARTDIPERLRRPYTQFSGSRAQVLANVPNFGVSNYHAFGLKAEKRFSRGLGYIVSYTWSKWIDNVPFVGEDAASFGDSDFHQDIYNIHGERADSNNHIPHRLVVSPIYELPFGKSKRWLSRSGLIDKLAGGWRVSTVATFQSGSPFGITVLNGARDLRGDAAAQVVLRPNVVGDHQLTTGKGQAAAGVRGIQWFNPSAFAAPDRFTLGNLSRTLAGNLGPGIHNFDIALSKNVVIAERYALQFRWETFNSFNTPVFSNPGDVLFGSGFGTASADNSHRETQFALKLQC